MVERFRSSSRSALDAATTVDLPAQFLGNIIRKAGAAIGAVVKGVAKKALPILGRVARAVRRVIGR